MVRMCATGRPPLASRRATEMAVTSVCGSTRLRTIHQSGVIRELNAVTLSGICATGMYRVGNGSRLRPPSRMSPAMPII